VLQALNKILLVEDDALYGETLVDYLEENGFAVRSVSSVQGALDASFRDNFDIYIFDIYLQNENGINLLRELKDAKPSITALFLTSDPSSTRATECFDAGCFDYIRKSCDFDEILARIKNAVRTVSHQVSKCLELDTGHRYDFSAKTLTINETVYDLNLKDILLLELLLSKRGVFVTLDEITDKLWASAEEPSFGSLRVYISNLKKILGKESIQNVRGLGYKLVI